MRPVASTTFGSIPGLDCGKRGFEIFIALEDLVMGLYTFTLEKFGIDNTRSRHEDTDTLSFGLQIGPLQFPVQLFSAGDVNNGDHAVDLIFPFVFIADPDASVVFSYSIYNGDQSKLPKALADLTKELTNKGMDDLLNPNPEQADISDFTDPSQLDADGGDIHLDDGWFRALPFVELANFLFPDCDGFVAGGTIGQTKANWDDLIAASPNATYRRTLRYPGSDSPAGCGSNSDYTVTWSVTYENVSGAGPHSLRQFLQAHRVTLHPGLRSLSSSSRRISLKALMSLTPKPAS